MLFEQAMQRIDALACLRTCPDHGIAQPAIQGCRFLHALIVWQIDLIEADQWVNLCRLADGKVTVEHTKMRLRLCCSEDQYYLVEVSEHGLLNGPVIFRGSILTGEDALPGHDLFDHARFGVELAQLHVVAYRQAHRYHGGTCLAALHALRARSCEHFIVARAHLTYGLCRLGLGKGFFEFAS